MNKAQENGKLAWDNPGTIEAVSIERMRAVTVALGATCKHTWAVSSAAITPAVAQAVGRCCGVGCARCNRITGLDALCQCMHTIISQQRWDRAEEL